MKMSSDPLADLRLTIAQERRALLQGDFSSLETLHEAKERHILALPKARPSQEQLRDLRQAIERNQTLVQAAIRGVQTTRNRLAALQKVQAGLTTYQKDGTLDNRQTSAARIEKKA